MADDEYFSTGNSATFMVESPCCSLHIAFTLSVALLGEHLSSGAKTIVFHSNTMSAAPAYPSGPCC